MAGKMGQGRRVKSQRGGGRGGGEGIPQQRCGARDWGRSSHRAGSLWGLGGRPAEDFLGKVSWILVVGDRPEEHRKELIVTTGGVGEDMLFEGSDGDHGVLA
jgi:hypothetical protein